MPKPVWIPEKEAAQMLGYRPRSFRVRVKDGRIPVAYTTTFGRNFQYNKTDIEVFLLANSTLLVSQVKSTL